MSRRRLDAEEARELILEEARELFIEKGFTHATMDELRTRCGMSKGNLYYHFNTKDEILVQVLIRHSDSVMEDFAERTKNLNTAGDRLIVMAEIWGEECSNPFVKHVDEFVRDISISEDQVAELTQAIQRKRTVIVSLVIEAIKQGEIIGEDAGSISSCIFSLLEGTSLLCMSLPEMEGSDYVMIHRDNMKMLLNGLKGGKNDGRNQ